MTLKQATPHSIWPGGDGWSVAGLTVTPGQIASEYGLLFEDGLDSLDNFTFAAIQDGRGGQVWLFRYANSPEPGVEVIVDTKASRDVTLTHLEAEGLPVRKLLAWKAPVDSDPRSNRVRNHRADEASAAIKANRDLPNTGTG